MDITSDKVTWQVLDPINIRTVITRSGITQTIGDEPPQQLTANGDAFFSSSGLLSLLTGDFQALRAFYLITRGPDTPDGFWSMQLRPKEAKMAKFISAIDVAGCNAVNRVSLHQPGGDNMDIRFAPIKD